MTIRIKQNPSGFNLLETLLASSLLAGAVMTIAGLSARSVSTVRQDQEVEKAWELADMQLVLIDAAGVAAFQSLGKYSGVFAQAEEYAWEAVIQELEIENLFSVEITVRWASGPTIRRIRCQTRLCDPPEQESMQADTMEQSRP